MERPLALCHYTMIDVYTMIHVALPELDGQDRRVAPA
jgi:hypothetical protein